jgi:hypothetical protein
MVPLAQVLGAKNIIDVIQKIKPGLREKLLPPQMLTPTRKVSGNYGTYHMTVGERRSARVTNYGAPAQTYEPTGVSEVPVNFLHSFQDMPITPSAMMNLLDEGNENRQRLGMETIGRQIGDFAQSFKNLRVAAVMMLLANGKIMTDGLGRLTVDSTKAVRTIDMGIPAANKGNLPIPRYTLNSSGKLVVTSAPIISALWSSASTNILQQLQDLKQAAALQTGFPLKHAFVGKNVKSYLFANTLYQEFLKRTPQAQLAFDKNMIPDGFMDVVWHEMSEAFYSQDLPNQQGPIASPTVGQSQTGLTANQAIPIFGPNTVTFTPDFDEPWFEMIEGSFPIPTGDVFSKDAMELLSSLEEAFGHFGFAKMGVDKQPSQIVQYQGDTFLPVILIPYSVFIATVA